MTDQATADRPTVRYTPTQRKILELLGDGQPHSHTELRQLCDYAEPNAVKAHIYYLRLKLRSYEMTEQGRLDIVCDGDKRVNRQEYRLVRLSSVSFQDVAHLVKS